MGGSKGSDSSNGNFGNMFAAMAAMDAANKQYELGKEQLAFAKDQYNEFKPYMLESTQQSIADQKWSSQTARDQYDFYAGTYKPLETKFVEEATSWDSPDRRERMAGQAQAAVASQFEQARTAAQQQLESFGVDPTSTRFASLDLGTRVQQAATAAGAGTKAIQDVENTGMALRGQAINTGRGYQQNVNQTVGTGTDAGASGTGTLNNFYGNSTQSMTAPVQWYNAGNQSMGNAITGFNNYTSNNIRQQQANTAASTGMMQNITGALGAIRSLNDGGPVDSAIPDADYQEVRALPAPSSAPYQGTTVPAEISPSRGAIPDDVPARLAVGEFVIPEETVSWVGERTLHQLIDKSEKERAEAEAQRQPSMTQAIPGFDDEPRFISQSAIPA